MNSFDFMQSDEFAREYEDWLRYCENDFTHFLEESEEAEGEVDFVCQ